MTYDRAFMSDGVIFRRIILNIDKANYTNRCVKTSWYSNPLSVSSNAVSVSVTNPNVFARDMGFSRTARFSKRSFGIMRLRLQSTILRRSESSIE